MSQDMFRNRLAHMNSHERDTLLVRALEALDWAEMADADPEASRRKGYFDEARAARRAVLRDAGCEPVSHDSDDAGRNTGP